MKQNYCILYDKKGRLRSAAELLNFITTPRGDLLLLEIAGASSTARAIWSNIVKRRAQRSSTRTEVKVKAGDNFHDVRVIPGTKYHKIERGKNLLLIHEAANKFNRKFIFSGPNPDDQPPPLFTTALQNVNIPFLEQWSAALWTAGRTERRSGRLIVKLENATENASAYFISQNTGKWIEVLKELHAEGKLTRTDTTD